MNEFAKNAITNRVFFSSLWLFLQYKFGSISKFSASKMQMEIIYRKYIKRIRKRDYTLERESKSNISQKNCWVYWNKEFKDAPALVKECINSIKKNIPNDYKLVILNDKNMNQYVSIPQFVYKLKEQNKISLAAFSDILRLSLLSQKGGIWFDATCFVIDKIPDFVIDSDFFCFKSGLSDLEVPNFQSWFIKSNSNNVFITNTLNILLKELKVYKKFPHYFYMFFIFQYVTLQFYETWSKMNLDYDYICYELQKNKQFSNVDYLKKVSFIQKLTYKDCPDDFLSFLKEINEKV